jgi:peptidoglycan/xylan/chitin deacetylase (PgdA/CDA1 family)
MRTTLCGRPLSSMFAPFTVGFLPVLMLHRFADPEDGNPRGHDPTALRSNLEYLRREGYKFLALDEALDLLIERPQDIRRAVAFTVDDGYEDFRRVAWPIFSAYECPVTVFVVSGFIDGSCWCWWDRVEYAVDRARRRRLVLELGGGVEEYAWNDDRDKRRAIGMLVERLKQVSETDRLLALDHIAEQADVACPDAPPSRYAPLSWDDVRFLSERGVRFGPHSVSHPILSRTSAAQAEEEIRASWGRLRAETEAVVPVFCYPNGQPDDFGEREMKAVARQGLVAAAATHPGFVSSDILRLAPYALPRFSYPEERNRLVQLLCGLERVISRVRRA